MQQTLPELSPPPSAPAAKAGPEPAPVWLQRLSLGVFVLFCFYIGGLLALLPWNPNYWDHNGWIQSHPALETILTQGWARGIVSGIGLIDIWIAISELLHYRDYRPGV